MEKMWFSRAGSSITLFIWTIFTN